MEIFNSPENMLNKLEKKYPLIKIHSNVDISDDCQIESFVELWDNVSVAQCSIGKCTYIASNSRIHLSEIGRFCSIGHDVKIGLGKHPSNMFVSTYPSFYNREFHIPFIKQNEIKFQEFELIKIGNDVWIGDRVLILDGVTIGDGAIIGTGAVVIKDVEPYSVSVGVPAKKIKKRFSEKQISFLLEFRWWDKDDVWFQTYSNLFEDIENFINFFQKKISL